HRETTGREIWEDTDGEIDAFVAGVGTGGTITGVSEYIKEEEGKEITSVAVEPEDSAVLSGEEAGSHSIQGIGAGFVPDVLRVELIDEVVTVSDDEAGETTRQLARQEGILAGISSGAAVKAAMKYEEGMDSEGELIVVVLPDTGERYLSTELFD
ncbi:MAG: pyridoxal-phosphate dependent enzyme, partial [Halobacteria archaeon]|nr:pyridoxal-phosphate dependent enzyme [Halobacteria archaeon]